MRHSVPCPRSVLLFLFILFVFLPVSLFSQGQRPQPDDSTASAPRGGARTSPNINPQDKEMEGVEQDDPGLRLEWEKKAWGTANPEFRRHSLREANKHNQRL